MFQNQRQYLYLDMFFLCNGSVTKWIFGAEDQVNNQIALAEFQIWRQQSSSSYNRVTFSSITFNDVTMIGTNLYEFIPQIPLQFQEGDIFGVYIPSPGSSRLVFYEQKQSGPLNRFRAGGALSTITGSLDFNANNYPLVAAELSISTTTTSGSSMITETSTVTGVTTEASIIPSDTISGPVSTSKSIFVSSSSASMLASKSVFDTSSSRPLSPTTLSTASAIIIGVTVTTVCIVAIVTPLIIVACICVKRNSSAINKPSDDGNIQQGTTGSITTKVQDNMSSLKQDQEYRSISHVITTDNPAYGFNVIFTNNNPAYNVTNNSAEVEDNAEYVYIN
ncbi:PREDICTED: cell wall integrity and stress response component 4-like [Amphimedon queenslandica]|uniref:Uncharacterized protein n=1 Tax=Amphimedon queenslandica TaxID=400682 RepID=A0AAN0JFP5_AMPQE|nr:PREDICTED: cell wall integrity and stress response component 4-like [Amphimedon queenslandica]|eukprot:XP_019855612.1 PREDICTED: cell wall integrity and stress response component 4-like [Amphimedon queenslandica]